MSKILIADDEAPICMALKETLERIDVDVDLALDGKEAYEMLLKEHYDVVLLDIYMPGMNGLDIAKAVKEKGIDTDIMIITGQGTIDDTIKALEIQIEEFITKPFRFDIILESVKETLEKRSQNEKI